MMVVTRMAPTGNTSFPGPTSSSTTPLPVRLRRTTRILEARLNDLEQRLGEVKLRIARAAERAGRDTAGITLLAVTKIFPAQAILDAYALGVRVSSARTTCRNSQGKLPELAGLSGARFHLIGHLQTNKSRQAAEMFDCIQTVDSAKLARRLNDSGKTMDIMLEVKLSPEAAKAGASPE